MVIHDLDDLGLLSHFRKAIIWKIWKMNVHLTNLSDHPFGILWIKTIVSLVMRGFDDSRDPTKNHDEAMREKPNLLRIIC